MAAKTVGLRFEHFRRCLFLCWSLHTTATERLDKMACFPLHSSRFMPLNVSYMGTKRRLASTVSEVISVAPSGPVLDLFSGMCAVASAVGPARQVWCNDVQCFAAAVAAAFFTSTGGPSDSRAVVNRISCHFRRNARVLEGRFASELSAATNSK